MQVTGTRDEKVASKPAAAMVLLRDRKNGLQVLLPRSSDESRFMGGNYVFPGGMVEIADPDRRCVTAGDIRDTSTKQVVSAAGEGSAAALMIREYLKTV